MQTVIIDSPTHITREMLQEFVRELGGEWRVQGALENGYLSDGQSSLWVSANTRVERALLDAEEWEAIVRQLGCEPRSQVALHLFSSPGKRAFAEHVAGEIVQRWGGLIEGLE